MENVLDYEQLRKEFKQIAEKEKRSRGRGSHKSLNQIKTNKDSNNKKKMSNKDEYWNYLLEQDS